MNLIKNKLVDYPQGHFYQTDGRILLTERMSLAEEPNTWFKNVKKRIIKNLSFEALFDNFK